MFCIGCLESSHRKGIKMNVRDPGFQSRKVKLTALRTIYETQVFLPDKRCVILLTYCCKGTATVTVLDREFALTPGFFLLSHTLAEHNVVISDAHTQCYILEICSDPDGIDLMDALDAASYSPFALIFQSADMYVRFDTEENRILLTIGELANELANSELANKRLIRLLFEALLIKIERAVQNHGLASGFSYVAEAKQYIQEHISSELTVQSIAAHIGIHRSYLMRIFRQQTHVSVNHYINRMRITQATVLLADSGLSITEIAFQVGFNSRQNFFVVFKKMIGCTPSKYRISHGVKDAGGRRKEREAEAFLRAGAPQMPADFHLDKSSPQ